MKDILNLVNVLWRYRLVLTSIVVVFGAIGVAVALLSPETFRAQTVLSPVESASPASGSSLMSQLAGLPGISSLGISAGSSGVEEHIAFLTSRSFTEKFIRENKLVEIINRGDEAVEPEDASWQAYKEFDFEIRRLLRDPSTGLVTLAIDWGDPVVAAEWANAYVEMANEDLRQQALARAEKNIAFANEQLTKTTVVELQQAIYRLIEAEIRSAMMAQGQKDFAFRVVDVALPPGEKYRPRRALVVVVFGLLGVFVGGIAIIIAELGQLARAESAQRQQA